MPTVTVREVGSGAKYKGKEGAQVGKESKAPQKGKPSDKGESSHKEEKELEDASSGGIIKGDGAYTESGRMKYVNPLSLGITEWNPDEIPLDSFIICYGKRRTGKSYWTRDFFEKVKGLFWHVNVYTGSKNNGFYQKFVDDKFIIKGFQPVGLRNLMDIQDHLSDAKLKGDIPEDAPIEALVWLDDVIQEEEIRHSEEFNQTATMGRHMHLCVGVNTQHVTGIPPVIRTNADIVVIFTQLNWKYKKVLAEEYLGNLNMTTAIELIDYYTRDHGCLVLELWRNDADPKTLIHYYKAQDPGAFSVHKKVPEYIEDELKQGISDSDDEDDVDLDH
jgi:hypothetical protein